MYNGILITVGDVKWVHLTRNNCSIASGDMLLVHCVSKNDICVTYYNFYTRKPILTIFCRFVAERVCHQMVSYFPHHVSIYNVSALPGKNTKNTNATLMVCQSSTNRCLIS